MTEIYLIRHAQSEGNLFRMMQGHWDGNITPLGARQLDALAERTRGLVLDAVYSSDLTRARMTAEAVTRYSAMPVRLTKALREIDLGPWEGCFFGDLRHDEPEKLLEFMSDMEHWSMEGAESCADVAERIAAELTRLAEAESGKCIAVVSHGVAIRLGLCRLLGIPVGDLETLPIPHNTGITHLYYDNGKFSLDYFNDAAHVSSLDAAASVKRLDLRAESFDPASDPEFYIACYRGTWLAAHGDLSGFAPQPYLEAACAHYAADPRSVLRILHGDEAVGLVDLDIRRGAHAGLGWISLLYLVPELRGKGLGIQLLARALRLYSSLGRTALRLHAAEENEAALCFYKSCGFRELSYEAGARGRLLLMEKKLGGHGHG